MFDLTGKTALVTGATGGIGAAIAASLHGQGAHVVLSGTREAVLADRAAELGDRVSVVPANLADLGSIDDLAKRAEETAGGGIDILVNNAGITRDGLLMRMNDEDWDAVLAVNLTAGFRLSRALVRGMMKRRWGRIIGISSIVGATGNPGQANYAAASSFSFWASASASVMAVSMNPGATTFTVMPRLAISAASAFENPTMPALAAA
jgi:3-oxoacyl-[acyl-carrier protein] reductase